jgi:hypothetical protein
MERKTVAVGKSSQVVSIGFDKEQKILEIEFSSGGVYDYFGVPESLYEEFIRAESLGVFVGTKIRGAFQYSRIHTDGLSHAEKCGDENCFCAKLTKTSRETEKPSEKEKPAKKQKKSRPAI